MGLTLALPASRLRTFSALCAAAVVAAGCVTTGLPPASAPVRALAAVVRTPTREGQWRLERGMDRSMLALARRLDTGRHADLWGRMTGWAALDLTTPPTLAITALTPQDAMRLNGYLPLSSEPPTPAAPFVLRSVGAERERAVFCLTQAIYYEAALEPTLGQEAVAQVILNRMRHPAFPKSVCGVVYQGSAQITGCQFTFTCDGSRERPPAPEYWDKARLVAEQALRGFVAPQVGAATHYHADYVFPRWGPTLVKIAQIGAHIFYRFPGPAGKSASFQGPYAGGELNVSMEGPSTAALLAAQAAAAAGQVPVGGDAVIDPTAAPHAPDPTPGHMVYGRRVPTKDEIAKINAALAAFEAQKAVGASPEDKPTPVITPPPNP